MVIAVGGDFLYLVIESFSINVRHIFGGRGVVGVSQIPQMCSCEKRAFNMILENPTHSRNAPRRSVVNGARFLYSLLLSLLSPSYEHTLVIFGIFLYTALTKTLAARDGWQERL